MSKNKQTTVTHMSDLSFCCVILTVKNNIFTFVRHRLLVIKTKKAFYGILWNGIQDRP